MEQLWSMSTTIREAERLIGFTKTALELDGEEWTNETQVKYQTLLIKNRYYLSPDNTQSLNGLNNDQIKILSNLDYEMTYEEARGIFEAKQYQDPPMRGRQSLSPLKKLGLVYINEGRIVCTDLAKKLVGEIITLEEFMFDTLLKYQYPNPMDSGYRTWNTKPFINTLRLIKKVNQITHKSGEGSKGISSNEFGIFALSLKDFHDVDKVANKIVDFRRLFLSLPEEERSEFVLRYIDDYLSDFNNPKQNVFEYADNMIRYLRLTKYIYIRGKYSNIYIDLEPRRLTEIDSILDNDNGEALHFEEHEWYSYLGTYGSYQLPFETVEVLSEIANNIVNENNQTKSKLNLDIEEIYLESSTQSLKTQIQVLREERTYLQNLEIKQYYHNDSIRVDEAIIALTDILGRNRANLGKKFSIELEKWANIALNIINDANKIIPNTKVGDDNEPIFTAPSGVPDIECFYDTFNSICEVTMLTGRDQWYNEGQPVMRHLRDFERKYCNKISFCLFVAPSLHVDTLNTFFFSNKYGYDGIRQKIVPITINELIKILKKIKGYIESGQFFSHKSLKILLEDCANVDDVSNINEWNEKITSVISQLS